MKKFMVAIILAGSASISAFAQTPAPAQAAQWASIQTQSTTPRTRAEVRHELVQAERDGQIQYLNSTVYAHQ